MDILFSLGIALWYTALIGLLIMSILKVMKSLTVRQVAGTLYTPSLELPASKHTSASARRIRWKESGKE